VGQGAQRAEGKIKMNTQEIFNKVCEHLITQNKQALHDDASCMYHAANGLKCAVGCLISVENYDPCFEENNIDNLLDNFHGGAMNKKLYGMIKTNRELLQKLQHIHDGAEGAVPENWAWHLRALAAERHLTPPACILEKEN